MGAVWRVKARRKLSRWKWSLFRPVTPLEEELENEISKLESLEKVWNDMYPYRMDSSYRPPWWKGADDTEKNLIAQRKDIVDRLQQNSPVLILMSGRRLERLTQWLIILTIVLSVLTALSVITRL